ncbi:MAG: galactokinase, partial [Candidatus Thorarchaeota archaeon]|nr:galactokinase [Candidatus Thorarchaeota archaeon]
QFTSQLGQPDSLLSIDCRSLMTYNIPFKTDATFVVVDSMISRVANNALEGRRRECLEALKELQEAEWSIQSLSDIQPEYLHKVADVLDERLTNRVTHVVDENQRVRKGIAFLKANDISDFGSLMVESHNSSRDLYEVSHPNLDFLVDVAGKQDGVFGARLTGAGFGGAVLALVNNNNISRVIEVVSKEYETEKGIVPNITTVSIPGGVKVEQV